MIRIMAAVALVLLIACKIDASAQTGAGPPAPDQSQQLLSAGQLDALLAPIALYPDALIAEILMASTYPLEVVEAERWVRANKNLTGNALKAAVSKQPTSACGAPLSMKMVAARAGLSESPHGRSW